MDEETTKEVTTRHWTLPVGECSHPEGHHWLRIYDWLNTCSKCHASIELGYNRGDEAWYVTTTGKRETSAP